MKDKKTNNVHKEQIKKLINSKINSKEGWFKLYIDEDDFYVKEYEYLYEKIKQLNTLYKRFSLLIDNDKGFIRNSDGNIEISNFFIEPICYINYYNEHSLLEKMVYIKVFSIENSVVTSIVLKANEFDNINWLDSYCDTTKYHLYNKNEYKTLKKAVELSIKQLSTKDAIIIKNFAGWRRGNKKWKYKILDKSIIKEMEKIKIIEYKDSLKELFNAAFNSIEGTISMNLLVPLLAFSSLSLIKELLKEKNIEPNFVMLLAGKKDTGIIRLGELVGNIFHTNYAYIFNKGSQGYISDSINDLQKKAAMFKDSLFVVDGISTGKPQDLNRTEERFLRCYYEITNYNKKARRNNSCELNRLCILLNENVIENNLYYNVILIKGDINNNKINDLVENKQLISSFFYAMVANIAKKLEEDEKAYLSLLKEKFKKYKKQFIRSDVSIDVRKADILSWLLLGYDLILEYGLSVDAITEEKYENLLNTAVFILGNEKGNREINSDEPNDTYLNQVELFLKTIHKLYVKDNKLFGEYGKTQLNIDEIGWTKETRLKNEETKKMENKRELLFNESSISYLQGKMKKLELPGLFISYNDLKKALRDMDISRKGNENGHYGLIKVGNSRYIAITLDKLNEYIKGLGIKE